MPDQVSRTVSARAANEDAASGWTRSRLIVALMIAFAFAFDGFDSTLLGLTVAQVSRDFGVSLSGFAAIFAISLGGMAAGTFIGGLLGDRFGRRWPIIGSLLLFGSFTALGSLANDITIFAAFRFLAALALGGLLPNGTAFIAELAPARWRGASVMLVVMTMSVGQILSGLVVAQLADSIGWRGLFLIGGLIPVVHAIALIRFLPESPGYLACRPERSGELAVVTQRLGLSAVTVPTPVEETVSGRTLGMRQLFSGRFRRDTFALIASFFFEMLFTYSVVNWLPTAVRALQVPDRTVGLIVASYHTGSVVGIPLGIWAISRLGSRRLLPALGLTGAIGAFVLTAFQIAPSVGLLCTLLIVVAAVNAIIVVSLYSLCVEVYPVAIRTRGVGLVGGIGRIGALASSGVGAYALGLGGPQAFFAMVGIAGAITAIALALLRTSLPPRAQDAQST